MSANAFTPTVCPSCGVALPPRKLNMSADIANVARQRPDLSYREIALSYQVSERTVKRYSKRGGVIRKRGAKKKEKK